jgi:GT2 family glycosyltransferase
MNGNCVLVTREAARRTGNFSAEFTHAIGDFDYGLRARAAGCTIWVTPGFVGTCIRDSASEPQTNPGLSLKQRWNRVNSPKGLPFWEYREYARKHGGLFWPVFWILPYLRFPTGTLRFGK